MRFCYPILLLVLVSCKSSQDQSAVNRVPLRMDTIDTVVTEDSASPAQIVAFSKTLLGTPYKFGSATPEAGLDCSGFITYVFNHFSINVPRSSVGFTNEGTVIPLASALPGDLILFTGTNSNVRTVGHMGLIVANDTSGINFIHSSSGKDSAVIITQLDDRYMARFVKVIRILKD